MDSSERAGSARAALNLAGFATVGALLLEQAMWAHTALDTRTAPRSATAAIAHAQRWAYTPSGGLEGALWALQRVTKRKLGLERGRFQFASDSDSNPNSGLLLDIDTDFEIVYGREEETHTTIGKGEGVRVGKGGREGEMKAKL